MNNNTEKIFMVAGPTASGKSGLAVRLAKDIGTDRAVIINGDSMQIFKGLPILTACPTMAEKENIPHLFYEYLSPDAQCSVAFWIDLVRDKILDLRAQNKVPIIVGGTGLYLKNLITGLSEIPEIDAAIRSQLTAELAEIGREEFYAELLRLDPETAQGLDIQNTQRLLRAMEVFKGTGRGLKSWQKEPAQRPLPNRRFDYIQIMPDRAWLYERCNLRFEKMLEQGALEEIAQFHMDYPHLKNGHDRGVTKSLGYEFLSSYLRGDMPRDSAIEKSQQQTRNYAKRQMTWLRHQMPKLKEDDAVINWREISQPDSVL